MGGEIKIPCPVCGSIDIEQNRGSNGICGPGYHSWVISEFCNNCGVQLQPKRRPYIKEVGATNSQQPKPKIAHQSFEIKLNSGNAQL